MRDHRVLHRAFLCGSLASSALLLAAGAAAPSDGTWGLMAPPPRTNHSVIYDPLRERMVLFGGFDGAFRSDVWVLPLLNGSSFFGQAPVWGTPPPVRDRHAAIYDPVRDRMVIFGGRVSSAFSAMSDVWELTFADLPTWTQILPTGTAVPLWGASAVYDPVGDRMVTFGGQGNAAQNLTRELTFSGTPAWNDLAPTGTLPPARREHVAVYDPTLGRMIVFGGISGSSTRMNDVWVLTLGAAPAWSQVTPAGTPPSARNACAGMFDSVRNRLVIFGGTTASGSSSEVWSLDFSAGATWSQILPGGTVPSGRRGPAIYDAPRDRLLHYGGSAANEVWALSFAGSPAWTQIAPWGPTPSERYWFAKAYDPPPRNRLVVYGGKSGNDRLDDTWVLDLPESPVHANHSPVTRVAPENHSAFGGQWTQLVAAGTAGNRATASMIYDPLRERAILFGGNTSAIMNDVWALSLNGPAAWTQLAPAGTPPPARQSHTAIYDPPRDRMVVFGGDATGGYFSDTWALSLAGTPGWSQLFPSGTAPALDRHTAIYDPGGDRMIVFGGFLDGCCPGDPQNGVWALSLGASPEWTALAPSGTPPPFNQTDSQAAVYDAVGVRMLVNVGSGIYELTLDQAPAWRQLELAGDPMVPTFGQGMALDPGSLAYRIAITGAVTTTSGLGMPVRFVDLESSNTGVGGSPVRSGLVISGISPNPSDGLIDVSLTLPRAAPARVEVLDLAGRRIASHVLDGSAQGPQQVRLRLQQSAPPGLYLVCLHQGGRVVSRPAVIR